MDNSEKRLEAPERIWVSPVAQSEDWPVWACKNYWADGVEYVRAPSPDSIREKAERAAREWMNTHHASFATNKEREKALVDIIMAELQK